MLPTDCKISWGPTGLTNTSSKPLPGPAVALRLVPSPSRRSTQRFFPEGCARIRSQVSNPFNPRHADIEQNCVRPKTPDFRYRFSRLARCPLRGLVRAATRSTFRACCDRHRQRECANWLCSQCACRPAARPAAASSCSIKAGSVTKNSLPLPGPSLRASIVPPLQLRRACVKVRPIPSPACDRSEAAVRLIEHLEDMRQLIAGDTDAVVLDGYDRLIVLGVRAQPDISSLGRVFWRRC